MTRAGLALTVALVAVLVVVGLLDTVAAAALTALLLGIVAAVGLGAALLAARRRHRLGSLRAQLSVTVLIAVGQMVLVAGLFAAVMFFSGHDAVLVVLVSAFTGLVALLAARIALRPVLDDIAGLADGLAEVGFGRRDDPVRTGGRDELAVLADSANRMTERLATEERARQELIAAVSHDLRTPLTSLRLLVEALGDGVLGPDEQEAFVERTKLQLHALSSLIDDLLELSRLETGDVDWSLEPVELEMLVGDTVDAMRAQADAKQVEIACDVRAELPPVQANPEKLQRVLFNLLHNAIRHTPSSGRVTVTAEAEDSAVEIEVADTGEGVVEQDRERIFLPFVQGAGREARGEQGSSGLGLAIARAIVEAHGGRMWLARAQEGARVRFSLPAACLTAD